MRIARDRGNQLQNFKSSETATGAGGRAELAEDFMSQSPRAGDGGTAAAFRPGRAAAASWHAGAGEQGAKGARPEAGGAGAEPCHSTAPGGVFPARSVSRPHAQCLRDLEERTRETGPTTAPGPPKKKKNYLKRSRKEKKYIRICLLLCLLSEAKSNKVISSAGKSALAGGN